MVILGYQPHQKMEYIYQPIAWSVAHFKNTYHKILLLMISFYTLVNTKVENVKSLVGSTKEEFEYLVWLKNNATNLKSNQLQILINLTK